MVSARKDRINWEAFEKQEVKRVAVESVRPNWFAVGLVAAFLAGIVVRDFWRNW
jgi:hypothetical protein